MTNGKRTKKPEDKKDGKIPHDDGSNLVVSKRGSGPRVSFAGRVPPKNEQAKQRHEVMVATYKDQIGPLRHQWKSGRGQVFQKVFCVCQLVSSTTISNPFRSFGGTGHSRASSICRSLPSKSTRTWHLRRPFLFGSSPR